MHLPRIACVSLLLLPWLIGSPAAVDGGVAQITRSAPVLKAESMRHYVDDFNKNDRELYAGHVPNSAAWDFLKDNIPLLDCPDKKLEEIYYFRWWTFRKHIQQTPDGFIITEFLPKVGWAGEHNSINCAAGHHFREGRWLGDPKYLDDYSLFWFRKGGGLRAYSFWAADSLWARFLVSGDDRLLIDLFPDLLANYEAWEKTHRDPGGLFWQTDDRDGMEVSLGGSGYRATINSYMYGDAMALARIAGRLGRDELAASFRGKAAEIQRLVQERLWDKQARFFKVLPRGQRARLCDARELHGYTPWYFDLPEADKSVAWKQLLDPQGFAAPYGPTTAERRHPKFALSYQGHECQWNGPSWPYSTSVTLTALANLLNDYQQDVVSRKDYFDLLSIYARSQHLRREDGTVVPWIDENLNPLTGDWISRTRLKTWKNDTWDQGKGGEERGKDYNHSTFCDLVINGLVGLRPRADETVEVNPLVPDGAWDYFCVDKVRYHGRRLTILFDRNGEHYHLGRGLRVFANGELIAAADRLQRITAPLPPATSPAGVAPPVFADPPAAAAAAKNLFQDRSVATGKNAHPTAAVGWAFLPDGGSRGHETASKDLPAATVLAAVQTDAETTGGWVKYEHNPVLGGKYGTCFDISVLREGGAYRMWVSWRPKRSVALVESQDGIHWGEPPRIVLGPRKETGWEDDINRPVVLKRQDGYHIWYTGQAKGHSWIGYATSPDGLTWKRMSDKPVLSAQEPWEKVAVMCPHVIWDEPAGLFRMWYSGGEQYEPNAMGYATSPDGLAWTKHPANPVFRPDPKNAWEQQRVTGGQVVKQADGYLMFYIGFRDVNHAQIGVARSKDGITDWRRHPANPIIRPGKDRWDHDACYKPLAIFDGRQWLLWYNGRHGGLEQIGVVLHAGLDLGF